MLPAVSDAFRGLAPRVVVQHDGAPGHTGKGVEERLNAFGATLDPPVEIRRQPSQSPDTNILDLSFFRALAASIAKRRRGVELLHDQFNLDKLAAEVEAAYWAYSVDTLEKMWAYKSIIMKKIVEFKGVNCYDRRSAPKA